MLLQHLQFVGSGLIIYPDEITEQSFRLEGFEMGRLDPFCECQEWRLGIGREVSDNRIGRPPAMRGQPVAVKMIKAEFQVVLRMFGERRPTRFNRLPQQYAIDIGKQIHRSKASDNDATATCFTGITHVSDHCWKGT